MYIYTIHTHKMLNIVSKEKDIPEAVLVRAIEPVE
ncbi:MAG: DNA-3-methyladenine glycosylase [Candidatus Peribacteria bacterium]|nr:DNA-3-methyladenine glycosylase [Candidatus Peribacteria bacterium]